MRNFFATVHSKLCDGIGGAVKKLTATASLQRPISLQILSAKTMFELCQDSIQGKNFIYTSSDEIDLYRVSGVIQSNKSYFGLDNTQSMKLSH